MKITSNNIISLTEGQVSSLSLSQITDIHNQMCVELGLKTTKRFASKPKAIDKTLKVQVEFIAHQKAKKAKGQKVEKSPVGKYTNSSVLALVEMASAGTAMGVITQYLRDNGGEAKAQDIILHFVDTYEQKRGKADVDVHFARGYVTGAIRKGLISVK